MIESGLCIEVLFLYWAQTFYYRRVVIKNTGFPNLVTSHPQFVFTHFNPQCSDFTDSLTHTDSTLKKASLVTCSMHESNKKNICSNFVDWT